MKKKDITWALVEATDELAYIHARLDFLRDYINTVEKRTLQSDLEYGYATDPDIGTEEVRHIFGWPETEEVKDLKEKRRLMKEEKYRKEHEEDYPLRYDVEKKEFTPAPTACQPAAPVDVWSEEEKKTDEVSDAIVREAKNSTEKKSAAVPEKVPEDPKKKALEEAAAKIVALGKNGPEAAKARKERNNRIIAFHEEGMSAKAIAETLRCSCATVYSVLNEWRDK